MLSRTALVLGQNIKKVQKKSYLQVMAARKIVQQDDGKLKVLVDPAAQKLVMGIYKDYISEEDFSDIVLFIKDFDSLLGRYRKDKPLSQKEIEKIEDKQGGEKSGKEDADSLEGDDDEGSDNNDNESDDSSDGDSDSDDNSEDSSDDEDNKDSYEDDEDDDDPDAEKSVVVSSKKPTTFTIKKLNINRITAADVNTLKKTAEDATKAAETLQEKIQNSAAKDVKRAGITKSDSSYPDSIGHFHQTHPDFHELIRLQKEAAQARVAYRRVAISVNTK